MHITLHSWSSYDTCSTYARDREYIQSWNVDNNWCNETQMSARCPLACICFFITLTVMTWFWSAILKMVSHDKQVTWQLDTSDKYILWQFEPSIDAFLMCVQSESPNFQRYCGICLGFGVILKWSFGINLFAFLYLWRSAVDGVKIIPSPQMTQIPEFIYLILQKNDVSIFGGELRDSLTAWKDGNSFLKLTWLR